MNTALDITLALIRNGIEIPDLFVQSSAVENHKKRLLEMAITGLPKPVANRNEALGKQLDGYTHKASKCYDEIFTEEIRKLRPDWFVTHYTIAIEKKQQLLEMARAGKPKPRKGDKLAKELRTYISKSSSSCYDETFTEEIRRLRPDWLISRSEKASKNKAKLLEMAKAGLPRPNTRDKWGRILGFYIYKSLVCYDGTFDKKIRRLRPDWFNQYDKMKVKLLEMARAGLPKPTRRLSHYICKSSYSYDETFYKEIKELRPDWFVTPSDIFKVKLLEMARAGLPRPIYVNRKGTLKRLLSNYTCTTNKTYDENFDTEIRRLRPDWFVNLVDTKKAKLLDMARAGLPRPDRTKDDLGLAILQYTSRSNSSYDEIFDREIRTLRPDWFAKFTIHVCKQKLIEMAKSGHSKPDCKSKEYAALGRYIRKTGECYDEVFDKTIKRLRPDWFDTISHKKQQLLEMARSGRPKPRRINVELSKALSRYTLRTSPCYDDAFDRQIRELSPSWFKNK